MLVFKSARGRWSSNGTEETKESRNLENLITEKQQQICSISHELHNERQIMLIYLLIEEFPEESRKRCLNHALRALEITETGK